MQFDYILAALVGMIAIGAIASPVPEAKPEPEAEAEAVQARAEQFIGAPLRWNGFPGNSFQDNDFLDILKRDAEAEPQPLEARAEQGAQFIGSPFWYGRRVGLNRINSFNRFQDNDFIDILKRDAEPDPEALEARAEQNKQWLGNPCPPGWNGCFGVRPNFIENDFQDNDFLDLLKRDESGLRARAEQAEQAKQGEQFYFPAGRRFGRFNNFNRINRFNNFNRINRFNNFNRINRFGGWY
ncbi:hypothetical protein PRZ48_008172 [Zasmidium cellare]|uniref:Uncharacterized protein n=1 Tax=Zasmidium cellare TaxID=395010 RepID=A0ABR0EFH5_ZASCE|nr:hypothetical protein PRZ48_008172 [Zasmidium cellare]